MMRVVLLGGWRQPRARRSGTAGTRPNPAQDVPPVAVILHEPDLPRAIGFPRASDWYSECIEGTAQQVQVIYRSPKTRQHLAK